MTTILLIYVSALFLALILILPEVYRITIALFKSRNKPKDERTKYFTENIESYKSKLTPRASIESLKKEKQIIIHQLYQILGILFIVFNLPISLLRMCLSVRFGRKITWIIPVQLYELWSFLFLYLSFSFASKAHFVTANTISIVVILSATYSILDDFTRGKNGRIKLFTRPEHKIHISHVLTNYLVIVFTFATLHYSIASSNLNAYSQALSPFKSIYYSVISSFSLGFADITPLSNTARTITMIQVVYGFLFAVVLISVFLSVWSSKKDINNNVSDS